MEIKFLPSCKLVFGSELALPGFWLDVFPCVLALVWFWEATSPRFRAGGRVPLPVEPAACCVCKLNTKLKSENVKAKKC